MTRYRLIPTQGNSRSVIVEGDEKAARASAGVMVSASGVPVLVCAAPLDGIVRALFTVGGSDPKVKRR